MVLQNTDELQDALAELKNKNVELKKIISYIQTDNSSYKQKYKVCCWCICWNFV